MITVKRYSDNDKKIWDQFNMNSKNRLFMFDRNYMDYHRDRFIDHSLLFYDEEELIALFPACEKEGVLISHGGLTYGGFLSGIKMKQRRMNECFDRLINYGQKHNFTNIIYKTIPYIYYRQPSEEDRYALYANGASINTVDASTYINLSSPLKMSKGRKAQISRAKRECVQIQVLTDQYNYDNFIDLENSILELKHGTRAVHTSRELKILHDFFPANIHLFAALLNGEMIAGTVIYEYDQVIHTQYMAANDKARVIGALDLTIATVIDIYKDKKKWLDFGISTEHGRIYLNDGLIAQKEDFGGRTGVYEIWKLEL